MKRQILGSTLVIVFLTLAISGLIMYFTPYKKNIASLHTFFSLIFIVIAMFHIRFNKRPLANYMKSKKKAKILNLQTSVVFSFVIILTLGLYFELPVLKKVYTFGNELRNKQIGKQAEIFDYQKIDLENKLGNYIVDIELKKGNSFQYPLFAIWVEDSIGQYIETLYISKVMSSSTYKYGNEVAGKWESAIVRRPEALPYWSHQRGIAAEDGLYIPLNGAPDLDAVSGATPTNSFIISSKSSFGENQKFKVLIEVNQSFDWNTYYSKNKFPNDLVYSGSGQVGQPSLVYEAEFHKTELENTVHKIMNLIGHSHHSGKNGFLYKDLSNITTAKNIANRIIVSIDKALE